MHKPVVLASLFPYEFLIRGMKEPFVYMHCCRLNLRGWMRWYSFGEGIVEVLRGGGVSFGCKFPHMGKIYVVRCGRGFVVVGIYVYVMDFKKDFWRFCGVCVFHRVLSSCGCKLRM